MPPYQYQFPQRPLVNQDNSATIERANIPRSTFINTWTRKTAFDAGLLIPILVDEILPGDHMRYEITAYLRMSTPLFPMFDSQRVDTHLFFVPNRLVWTHWVNMMGEQIAAGDTINYGTPFVVTTVGGEVVGSIYDHMGIVVSGQMGAASSIDVNALPFRAYNLIFNRWFQDENVGPAPALNTGDGPDVSTDYQILRRSKSHDYFTSALPWPQKFTAPFVPVSGQAPVFGIGKTNQVFPSAAVGVFETNTSTVYANAAQINPAGVNTEFWVKGNAAAGGHPQIFADLSMATGVSINTLRQAWMVQSLLERDARGGTRYVELLRSHFGVVNPDFRLQRPEYIGGGNSPLNITPIAQTAPTTGVPLGAIGGAGTSAGSHRASYAATEHGFIIGLISIKSDLSYQQGNHKMWKRSSRFDYYWPALAQLGEQAVTTNEIYANGTATDTVIFGYQERWQEYRTRYSDVTGIMRSTAIGTLDAWHLAQRFTAAPVLNQTFLADTPPMSRILAAGVASAGQQYLCDILYHRTATRPIPTYGTPAILGRF